MKMSEYDGDVEEISPDARPITGVNKVTILMNMGEHTRDEHADEEKGSRRPA